MGSSRFPILNALVCGGMHPLEQAACLRVQKVQLRTLCLRGWLWFLLSLHFRANFRATEGPRTHVRALKDGLSCFLPLSTSYISTLTGSSEVDRSPNWLKATVKGHASNHDSTGGFAQ